MQLQQGSSGGAKDARKLEELLDDSPRDERVIVCRRCRLRITSVALRFEQAGRHHHTCINPAGVVFRIALYRDAPGCHAFGEWSEEYSWFASCAWQIVLCGRCHQHLGWRFRGPSSFYGLIRDKLDEQEQPGGS